MYHKRLDGQSKEVFRLAGGRHTRPKSPDRPVDRNYIERGDTLHITQREADMFGDKFELVLAEKAKDMTLTIEEDDTVVEEVQTDEDEEDTSGFEEVDVSTATGQGPLATDDFASPKAFKRWRDEGEPDLTKSPRTGHNGRTYSLGDVKKAL